MESLIKQKEDYNIYKKIQKPKLILQHKSHDFSRNNGKSVDFDKTKINFEKNPILNRINNQNHRISFNMTFYPINNISKDKSNDLPYDIKTLYKQKKYLNSLDNDKIKENSKFFKIRASPEKNIIQKNLKSNIKKNETDYTIYYKYSDLSLKFGKNNNKLTPINFLKKKDNSNNIKTFKYKDEKNNPIKKFENIRKKTNSLNLNDYSNFNKSKTIYNNKNYKNNNNLSTTLKGSLSSSNFNEQKNQVSNFFNSTTLSKFKTINNFNQKSKEDNTSLINYSSIEKKHSILLNPIKNIKSLNINKIKKASVSNDLLIPELSATNYNMPEKEKIKEKRNTKINFYSSNCLKNDKLNILTRIPKRENNINQDIKKDKVLMNNNKIETSFIRKETNNKNNNKIFKRIFNTATNTINNISIIEEENKNININNIDKSKYIFNLENEEKNKQNINENVKRHVLKRKKTKIRNFFLDKKKSNKFLEKIKNINNKYPNKDSIMTHQIKLNKKSVIEVHCKKITKMIKKQKSIKAMEKDYEKEINSQKLEYIDKFKNSHQELDNIINNIEPESISNIFKKCGLSSTLIHLILLRNELSSIFIPLVDITQRRKSFITEGKLYIINNIIKVFEDKKSKYIETKMSDDDAKIYQEISIPLISKELIYLLHEPDININAFESNNRDFSLRKQNNFLLNDIKSPKRNNTNKFITRFGYNRMRTRKNLTSKELNKIDIKNGIKTFSILERNDFFKIDQNKKIEKRLKRRRNSIIYTNFMKQFTNKSVDYIKLLNSVKNKGNIFERLKDLIIKGKVSLFFENFQENRKKFNLNSQDESGNTLLILSVKLGLNTIGKLLIKNGVDVNIQNKNGNSALHYALSGKNFIMADELRKYGAAENSKNKLGYSPWDCIGKNIDE